MLADFKINFTEAIRKPMTVQVKVHESVAALRGAATKFERTICPDEDHRDHSDILGVCHRFHMETDPVVALVRLAPPYIGVGIMSHEMAHAAVWLWEIQNKFGGVALNCENDEWFAWVLGELVRATTAKLYEKGVY